jgi:hypothetical protein
MGFYYRLFRKVDKVDKVCHGHHRCGGAQERICLICIELIAFTKSGGKIWWNAT